MKLGRVTVRYRGKPVECDLYDDGTIVMPDGQKKKLNKEKFDEILKDLHPDSQATSLSKVQGGQNPANDYLDVQQVNPFQEYDLTAEKQMIRKRRVKIIVGVITGILLVAVAVGLIYRYAPQILGFAPNSYKVVVANVDLAAGDTIESNEISYIELSRDEYTAQCVSQYMAENGSMKTDAPIFFVNANNQVVGRFAAEDISAGSIITASMVTTQKFNVQVEVNGQDQEQSLTESQLGGETNITIVARITQSDGTVQEVPLSSMKLQGKSLVDLLNGNGESILNQANEEESDKTNEEAVTSENQPAA